MVLSRFERRLERLVEGAFSKAFRSGLHPVEIARRLVREVEVGRTLGVRGPVAPNAFAVRLAAADLARFETFLDALVGELAQAVREHARNEGYTFVGPVVVDIAEDPRLKLGSFKVTATIDSTIEGWGAALLLPDGGRLRLDEDSPTVIGRLPDCAVRLSDVQVSRHHAEIFRSSDGWHVRDLGSTNGTLLNGATVKDARLGDGDEITIGSTHLAFQES
jgi:hypothetical protein